MEICSQKTGKFCLSPNYNHILIIMVIVQVKQKIFIFAMLFSANVSFAEANSLFSNSDVGVTYLFYKLVDTINSENDIEEEEEEKPRRARKNNVLSLPVTWLYADELFFETEQSRQVVDVIIKDSKDSTLLTTSLLIVHEQPCVIDLTNFPSGFYSLLIKVDGSETEYVAPFDVKK